MSQPRFRLKLTQRQVDLAQSVMRNEYKEREVMMAADMEALQEQRAFLTERYNRTEARLKTLLQDVEFSDLNTAAHPGMIVSVQEIKATDEAALEKLDADIAASLRKLQEVREKIDQEGKLFAQAAAGGCV
eukprot:gene19673-26358_t